MTASPNTNATVETKVDHNYHELKNEKVARWEASLPQEYWDYREKWNEYPKLHKTDRVPINLDIEATSNCNLKCKMCPRTDMVEDGTFWDVKNFDLDLYKEIVADAATKGLCSIKFNYLGEPLMNPNLVEMIRFAKEHGVVDVMFNTNATLLTEKTARQLIESGLDKLFFSFDSPFREHYNDIRVNANYDKVLRNIRRFKEIREEMGSIKPFTRVSMVYMEENKEEWEAFQELFEPLVDAVAYVDYVEHTSQKTKDGKTVYQIAPAAKTDKKFCCPQLWQRMFIHPDGVVSVCCVDSARELQVGNIHERSVEEIWNGPEYRKLRELHRTGRIEEIPVCANCHLAQIE